MLNSAVHLFLLSDFRKVAKVSAQLAQACKSAVHLFTYLSFLPERLEDSGQVVLEFLGLKPSELRVGVAKLPQQRGSLILQIGPVGSLHVQIHDRLSYAWNQKQTNVSKVEGGGAAMLSMPYP